MCGLSLAAVSRGCSFVGVHGLTELTSLIAEHGQGVSSTVVVNGLSCPGACGISSDYGSNLCPCIGRWIFNHWTIREDPRILTVSHLVCVCVCARACV